LKCEIQICENNENSKNVRIMIIIKMKCEKNEKMENGKKLFDN
jgi:hypothetical protein